jgi:hypothetical protein
MTITTRIVRRDPDPSADKILSEVLGEMVDEIIDRWEKEGRIELKEKPEITETVQ